MTRTSTHKPKARGNGDGSVFQLPNKKWRAQITLTDATTAKQVYRTKHAKTKTAAKAELEALKQQYPIHQTRKRRLYYPPTSAEGTRPDSLGELLDEWSASYMGVRTDVRGSTRDNYLSMIRVHLKPVLGHLLLSDLDVEQVDEMLLQMQARGLGTSTQRVAKTVLGMALDHAKRRKKVTVNVARDAVLPRNGQAREEKPWFDRTDGKKFLAAAKGSPLYVAWVLQMQCGLRGGEDLALSWEDIDFKEQELHIRHGQQRMGGRIIQRGETKTKGSIRTVRLSDDVLRVLKAHKAFQSEQRVKANGLVHWTTDDLVLTTPLGEYVRPEAYRREFRNVRDAAKLSEEGKRATPHSCRHTYASILVQDGKMPWADIAKQLGHRDLRMLTATYGHLRRDAPRGYEDELSDLMAT